MGNPKCDFSNFRETCWLTFSHFTKIIEVSTALCRMFTEQGLMEQGYGIQATELSVRHLG